MTGQTTARGAGGDGLKHIAIKSTSLGLAGCLHVFFEPGMTWADFFERQYELGSAYEDELSFAYYMGDVRIDFGNRSLSVSKNGESISQNDLIDENGTYTC